jgi:tocopherol O-methyltransferase
MNNKAIYHSKIKEYYASTENLYIDSWGMNEVHALHYGYYNDKVSSFQQSLLRMNEVMMQTANITKDDILLNAGCGVGGSIIFLAKTIGCKCTGITL